MRQVLGVDAVRAAYDGIALPGDDVEAWERCFWAWNDVRAWLSREGLRRYYHEAQDTRDEARAAAYRFFREAITPLQDERDAAFRRLFLASPHRQALEKRLGEMLFVRMALEHSAYAEVNIALGLREGELASRVERAYGAASLPVGGQELTLSQASALLNAPEEATRREAWGAIARYEEGHAERFHRWYDELVAVRHQMALNLGEASYTPVAYRKLNRSDYGPAEVAAFRAAVRAHVTPLLARVRERQAAWLGQPTVRPWDMTCFPGLSLGADAVPLDQQLARAGRLFHRLHPVLGGHFDTMVERGLIDLEARPGKRAGAFAAIFGDEVGIFCNNTGAETDVTVLMHEMGHAFQGWESLGIRAVDLRIPTLDAAELTSTGMEYLALSELTAFFDEDRSRRFARLKLILALQRMAYAAAVDDFQHWVYAHPGHSHREREQAWERSWDAHVPGIDFPPGDPGKRLRWVRQSHVFGTPFYYIDYALADVGALQLWAAARHDRAAALESYLAICRLGGTRSMRGIFAAAGLRSPFEPDVLAEVVADLERALDL